MTWNKLKIAGEVILFSMYLGTGIMMGWILSLDESCLEKTASTLSMSIAFILLWGIHRWRNIFIWKIETPIDGAITGAVIGAARAVTYFTIERTILNIYIDWLIIIGTGIVFGGVYGWSNGRNKLRK
ncbi:MAG: hypothetical protein C4583_12015 [Anaerolineaceae bacterium]|nr:MAG: hypothetical protein C4583_12015 [Anaerolineaceae bacterium]